jgi:hypothetical protein
MTDLIKPSFEYRVTFAQVPADFPAHDRIADDLAKISPKPPKGADWQLAGSTPVVSEKGTTIFYQWERAARERDRN